ncbi:MAG TPA: universal stress protein [Longimicrobiales bacterium]
MAAPILVPVDGSSFSEQAVALAADLAKRAGAPLHIVQVHTFSHPVAYPEIVPPYEPDWETALRIHQRDHLARLRNDTFTATGLNPTAALLEGPIVDCLVHYVESHGIGQIVMTSHGRGGLSRAWLGSVASELVRFVGVPVLLIRPSNTVHHRTELNSIRHVLVPLDGSLLSESVLPYAVDLARTCDARITLIEAVPPVYAISGGGQVPDVSTDVRAAEAARNETARYLEHVAGMLRGAGLNVEIGVLTHWQAAHAIIDYATDHAVDLIAMATHGRGAWSRWVVGSVADKVLRGCQIPMLVLRPQEALASADLAAGGHDAAQPVHS